MQKNTLAFIMVASFVISVLIMAFLNTYCGKNVAMFYVAMAWIVANAGLVKADKVFGL